MIECIPHPDDASKFLPVEDALTTLWRNSSALLSFESSASTQLDLHKASLDALTKRDDGTDSSIIALRSQIAAVAADVAALRKDFSALKDYVYSLPRIAPTLAAYGFDVGKSQTTDQVTAALASRPDFCIINATTGLKSVSPTLATHTDTARANADVVGFYHWGQVINDLATTPDKSDPVGEAQHFVSTVNARPGDVLALDLEEQLGTWPQRVAYAIAWLDEVKRLTGATPFIYLNWNWIKGLRTAATAEQWARLVAYPLWLAEWTGTPGQHSTVTSKDGTSQDSWPIVIHQYAVIDNIDRDWTPDVNRLESFALKG